MLVKGVDVCQPSVGDMVREVGKEQVVVFFFSSGRRHTRFSRDWSSDVCSSDLMPLIRPRASDEELLKLSRWLTAAWGIVLIAIAIMARSWGSVFTTGLTIASLVYGPMLGAFLLGVLTTRANQVGVMTGMAVTLGIMIFIKFYAATMRWTAVSYGFQPTEGMEWLAAHTDLAWTWFVLVGTLICCTVGYGVSLLTTGATSAGTEDS